MYRQLNIFDYMLPCYRIDKPIRLIELFAGIGSQAMALRDLGVDFEHYRVVEYDRFAVAGYNAIHGTDFRPADIRQISGADLGITDTGRYCYVMTYSFPCQDLSAAGRQKGMAKGSGTRSGLLWEVERLLDETEDLPQVLLMENVPQVHSKKNMPDFEKWTGFLSGKGYSNYRQDLNAKDYGVAQNRNRCFMVSILGRYNYKFPEPAPLKKAMREYLEDEVDDRYYIDTEKARKLVQNQIESGSPDPGRDYEMEGNFDQRGKVHMEGSICRTILGDAHAGNEQKVCVNLTTNNPRKITTCNCIVAKDYGISNRRSCGNGVLEVRQLGNIMPTKTRSDPNQGRVYDCAGLSSCITNVSGGGGREPMIVEKGPEKTGGRPGAGSHADALNAMPDGTCRTIKSQYAKNGIPNFESRSSFGASGVIVAMRGRNSENPSDRTPGIPTEQWIEPNSQGICNTLTSVQKDNMVLEPQYRIRKLTPLECWRLMGFSDDDFAKAAAVNSNTQLYKQAGNSIVRDVLMAIFRQLL